MLSIVHQFYAMASDCTVHLCGETAEKVEQFAAAAESEVRRIEMRYSRYRDDSELTRINKVAATGGSVGIDGEAELLTSPQDCFGRFGTFRLRVCRIKNRLTPYCPLLASTR